MRRLFAAMLLTLSVVLTSAVFADDPGAKADSIASQLESPFCPGRTLDACTSPAAAEWRHDIRTWVEQGVPPEEIRRRLEERAGRSLSATSTPGMAYGTLVVTTLASLLLLGFAYKKLFGAKSARDDDESGPDDEPPAGDDRLDEKLDRELALMD